MEIETSATREALFVPMHIDVQAQMTGDVVNVSSNTLPQNRRVTTRIVKTGATHSSVVSAAKATWPQKVLQNWEGVVVGVSENSFQAHMLSTLGPTGPVEYFDVDLDNVADGDIGLVREGAKFYLTVLSIIPPGESAQKTTRVVFRRLPRMRQEAVVEAEREATELWELLRPGYATQQASGSGGGQV